MPADDYDILADIPDLSQFGQMGLLVMTMGARIKDLEDLIKKPQVEARQSDYLTIKEAGVYLNRSYMTVYRLIQRGLIKATKDMRDYRIHISELEEYRKRVTF